MLLRTDATAENNIRDRARGLVFGAVLGARASTRSASSWPKGEDVLLTTAEILLEDGELNPSELLRRLIRAWALSAGKRRLSWAGGGKALHDGGLGPFAAVIMPLVVFHRNDTVATQASLHSLGRLLRWDAERLIALSQATLVLQAEFLDGPRQPSGAVASRPSPQVARSLPNPVPAENTTLDGTFQRLRDAGAGEAVFILAGAVFGAAHSPCSLHEHAGDLGFLGRQLSRLVDGLLDEDPRRKAL